MALPKEEYGRITDAGLARARSRIGQVYRPPADRIYFNTQACRDTIRHFCDGFGESNPLYRDSAYAKKTKYKKLIAPPTFLYSVYSPRGEAAGMPGVHGWQAGNDWKWLRPIMENDDITYENVLLDVVEKKSNMVGRSVIGYGQTTFKNQKDEVIAIAKGWTVMSERQAAKKSTTYRNLSEARYTEEEIKDIEKQILNEKVWGATPHYWEDVKIGEELPPVVKGPLTIRDIVCWMMGAGAPFMHAHGRFLMYRERHPAVEMKDSTTGRADVPVLVHVENTRSDEIGVPLAYDFAQERSTWLGQLMTNWIGDDGFLKNLYLELRRFNMAGDTTWCKGKVTKKYVEKGEHLVDIDCWGENQRGDITMPGHATVVLPSKPAGKTKQEK